LKWELMAPDQGMAFSPLSWRAYQHTHFLNSPYGPVSSVASAFCCSLERSDALRIPSPAGLAGPRLLVSLVHSDSLRTRLSGSSLVLSGLDRMQPGRWHMPQLERL
jgi:hypothetical protein